MKIISIFNQKGGVGKTTSVVNLAVALTKLSKKVLVVDIDPQANTSSGLGLDKYNIENSLYDLFCAYQDNEKINDNLNEEILDSKENTEDYDIVESFDKDKEKRVENQTENDLEKEDAIDINKYIINISPGLDIIASEANLSGLEVELVALDPMERTMKLKEILFNIDDNTYDFILIDCPPSLGLLSINALVASSSIIIPVQTEYYALEGIIELMNTYNLVKQELNTKLEIEGVLLTMFDKRASLSYEVVEEVKSFFKSLVFKVMIPRYPTLAEAPSHGLSSIDYDPNSKGTYAYLKLAEEIIKNESEKIND